MLNKLTICRQNRLTALQQEHAQHWSADLNCGEFMEGLAELCLYKVQSLQCVLGDLSRTHLFSLMLQQHIGPLRRQHRKLDKHIETMRSKMDAAIKQLLSWVAHLRLYQQHLRLDDDAVKQAYEAACVSSDQGGCLTVMVAPAMYAEAAKFCWHRQSHVIARRSVVLLFFCVPCDALMCIDAFVCVRIAAMLAACT